VTPFRTCATFAAAILYAAILPCHTVAAQVPSDSPTDNAAGQTRIAFSHALPQLDGGHLSVTMVEITYGPGESSPPHSHPCAVVGYVIEGALRTQVQGEAEAIYKTGESFYEAPNGVHLIAANASAKAPVKFLASFVCDHDTPLSVAPPETSGAGGK
jgi:quercetin dioxygenase-like cupin family protein